MPTTRHRHTEKVMLNKNNCAFPHNTTLSFQISDADDSTPTSPSANGQNVATPSSTLAGTTTTSASDVTTFRGPAFDSEWRQRDRSFSTLRYVLFGRIDTRVAYFWTVVVEALTVSLFWRNWDSCFIFNSFDCKIHNVNKDICIRLFSNPIIQNCALSQKRKPTSQPIYFQVETAELKA